MSVQTYLGESREVPVGARGEKRRPPVDEHVVVDEAQPARRRRPSRALALVLALRVGAVPRARAQHYHARVARLQPHIGMLSSHIIYGHRRHLTCKMSVFHFMYFFNRRKTMPIMSLNTA